jgi:hypothetical protein
MSKLFRLLASLFIQGIKPEEVNPDRFPGKKPPTAAPSLPRHLKQETPSSANQQILKHYKSFRRHYPNGYKVKRDGRNWPNGVDPADERWKR